MYPTRSESHIREEIGIATLKSLIPVEWILRDITGRDYGHDAILQITKTNSNEVLPYLIGIQIKYREDIQKPLIIKSTTYNYLHDSNNPNFIFVTNGEISKILCVNYYKIPNQGEMCQIKDSLFSYINNQQDLINYIYYYSHLIINGSNFKIDIIKSFYDFDIVFNAIENKDIESLWNYYKINIKRIHNVLIDRFWPIDSLYSQYFNICLDFDRLRQPYNKEDIFELMLLFLTCVCIENKRDGLNIPEEKKYRIQQYIKSIKYNT